MSDFFKEHVEIVKVSWETDPNGYHRWRRTDTGDWECRDCGAWAVGSIHRPVASKCGPGYEGPNEPASWRKR